MSLFSDSIEPIRLGINGYGRIGQCVLRALYENGFRQGGIDHKGEALPPLQVVAINELSDIETIAHLTKYDTTHGRFSLPVTIENEGLRIGEDWVSITRCPMPQSLNWAQQQVDLVLECTGSLADRSAGEAHLQAGAKRVLFSQPATPDMDKTIVFGVNENSLSDKDRIVSNASCTTNCIIPVIKALDDELGILQGSITTIHSAMNDQPTIDAYHHQDLRRTRSAMYNVVPVETGLAKGIERILPEMADKFSAVALRVPTINVSAIDMTLNVQKATNREQVNELLKNAAINRFLAVLGYTEEPLASCDFNHDSRSGIVDGGHTRVSGDHMVKVLVWFDNEWGFANRMLDVSRYWPTH